MSSQPYSICSCPYGIDCKHGVAVVLEFLECNELSVPEATGQHPFYTLLDDEDLIDEVWGNEDVDDGAYSNVDEITTPGKAVNDTTVFLQDKTKKELIDLIRELAEHYPNLVDRRLQISGEIKSLVKRLRREIREIVREPGWQNHSEGGGFIPDFSGIRRKLEALLKAGCADEVLNLGEELLSAGVQLVEESDDEGETGMEVSSCMPAFVLALEQSSLPVEDRLTWAVDVASWKMNTVCSRLSVII